LLAKMVYGNSCNNPNKLYAAMWEYRRWPWFFHSGGWGSGLHVSHDGGATWTRSTEEDGMPKGQLGRIGLAVSLGRFEGDLMYLRSNLHGGYVGARYRFMVGWLRPYAAVGMPLFIYDETDEMTSSTSKRVALGVRAAGGVELKINGHLSVHGDIGYERFFAVEDTLFFAGEATSEAWGTVEGALASGMRAARQVDAALNR
jgi:hypothetical protein